MDFNALVRFLKGLDKNNNKEWFEEHRKDYEALRKDWLIFVQDMIKRIAVFDPEIAGLEAKNCVFRINRDTRFSANKAPYKNNFGAYFAAGGKKSALAGYYLHIQPGDCFLAGGAYVPEPARLQAIRQEIDYNLPEFEKVLKNKSFKEYFGGLTGEKLARPPKGYEADNKAIEYLKHKSFLAVHHPDPKKLDESYDQYAARVFKAMHPLIHFLNRA